MADSELLDFFKALADASRLQIVGLLAHQPYTVEELAALLDLRPSTISHHLNRLSQAKLVSARADGYYSVYQLQTDTLQAMARRLLAREGLDQLADGIDTDRYARKVLRSFLQPDGSLREIPSQRKKRAVILRHILQAFQPDRRYSEAQVDEILARFHDDTTMLRRELIGLGWMEREDSVYRRAGEARRLDGRSAGWSVW